MNHIQLFNYLIVQISVWRSLMQTYHEQAITFKIRFIGMQIFFNVVSAYFLYQKHKGSWVSIQLAHQSIIWPVLHYVNKQLIIYFFASLGFLTTFQSFPKSVSQGKATQKDLLWTTQ